LLWEFDSGDELTSNAIVSEGKVFAGNYSRGLYCLDGQNGEELWVFEAQSMVSTPCVTKDNVFVPVFDGRMVCLDKNSGEIVWEFDTEKDLISSPVAHDGLLFFGSGFFDFENDTPIEENAFFYCLNAATGKSLWSIPTHIDFTSTPIIYGNNVIISSRDGNMRCLDYKTGKNIWTVTLKIGVFWSSVVLSKDRLFVNVTDKSIISYDAKTGKQAWKYTSNDYVGQPCVTDSRIYFADEKSELHCVDTETGKNVFKMPLPEKTYSTPSIQPDGKLFIGCNDGFVYMVDVNLQKIVWQYQTQGEIYTTPSIANGKLFVTSTDGKVYCFVPDVPSPDPTQEKVKVIISPKTAELQPGETVKFFAKAFDEEEKEIADAVFEWSCSDESIGTVDKNGLFTAKSVGVCEVKASFKGAFDTGKITVIKFPEPESETCEWNYYRGNNARTGVVPEGCAPRSDTLDKLWEFETGDDLYSSPTLANGFVFLGSDDMKIYCLEYITGKLIWEYKTAGRVFSPAVEGGKVYTGSYDRSVYCLSATDGKKIWQFETKGSIFSSPAIWENKVYIGSKDGNLYCLDALTGKKLWSFETSDQIDASPAIMDGKVYFGSQDRHVYCLDAKTGAQIWKFGTGYYITSSPTVAEGKVFIGSDDKNMYCLNANTGEKIWVWETGTVFHYSSPAYYKGRLYIGAQDSRLYCLDASKGVPLWNFEVKGWVYTAPH
jgi:outer membrane protein assembly factor BamB